MPVTVSGTSLDQYISNLEAKFNSPDLIEAMAESLAGHLQESFQASGLQSRSGAGLSALTYVGEPERTGQGWSMGVGDRDALGGENDPAPRGVLRQFFSDNPSITPSKWRRIPRSYKEQLEAMRRAGMYGGRGPNYANYMWIQNSGNATAEIGGRHFIESAVSEWKTQVPDIINDWWQSLGTVGRFKRRVAGVFGR